MTPSTGGNNHLKVNDCVCKLVKHIGKHVWELAATNNEAGTSNLFLAIFAVVGSFFSDPHPELLS